MKSMSLRLPDEQARALDAVAMAEEKAVSDVIRTAIENCIEDRRNDPDFQERLSRAVQRNQEALELLASARPDRQTTNNT
jgi:predicted DNA-binding protein